MTISATDRSWWSMSTLTPKPSGLSVPKAKALGNDTLLAKLSKHPIYYQDSAYRSILCSKMHGAETAVS